MSAGYPIGCVDLFLAVLDGSSAPTVCEGAQNALDPVAFAVVIVAIHEYTLTVDGRMDGRTGRRTERHIQSERGSQPDG